MIEAAGARHALYYAPAVGSPWWRFGAHWLGRDEVNDAALAHPDLPGLQPGELARITTPARRYGFHATLRAPFRLAPGADEAALIEAIGRLADRLSPVPLGALVPSRLAGFAALLPATDPAALDALARQCVLALEPLRAPLTDAQRARRRAQELDGRGRDLLEQFGYPYVMERFRFHMTLGALPDDDTAVRLLRAAHGTAAPLNRQHPPVLDRLCLFVEPRPGAPFLRRADFPLRGH
jgi:putative phosphonate metabolism protein